MKNDNNIDKSTAVLFVHIGWANRYDGTEAIIGGHRHLRENELDNTELRAFVAEKNGYYKCGIGRGQVYEPNLDIVFVARHPTNKKYQIVGLYHKVKAISDADWSSVKTKNAVLISPETRPVVKDYPAGEGMRRWAHRVMGTGSTHNKLYSLYKKVKFIEGWSASNLSDEELELSAFEGKLNKKRFIIHRQREAKLRAAKIRDSLNKNDGKLICEVPGCGFDFKGKYGPIGENFAIVHHITPLSELSKNGEKTTIADLAIVCANCHVMIHRGGECRQIETLINNNYPTNR